MDRVTSEQAGTLLGITGITRAKHDAAQPQLLATAGAFDQDPSEQTPNTTEAVEHNIGWFAEQPTGT